MLFSSLSHAMKRVLWSLSLLVVLGFVSVDGRVVWSQDLLADTVQSDLVGDSYQVADVAHASLTIDFNIPMRHVKGQVIYRLKSTSRGTDPLVFVGQDIDYLAVHKLGDNGWEPAIYAVRPDGVSLRDKLYVVMEDGFHALRISYIGTDQHYNIWSPNSDIDNPDELPKPYFFSQAGIAGVQAWLPLPDVDWQEDKAPRFGFDMKLTTDQNTALWASTDWPVYQSPLLNKGQSHFYQQQPINIEKLMINAFPAISDKAAGSVMVINSNPMFEEESFLLKARTLSNVVASIDGLLGVNHPWGFSIILLPHSYPDDLRLGHGMVLLPDFYLTPSLALNHWLPSLAYNRLRQYLEPASAVEQALLDGIAQQLSDHLLFDQGKTQDQHEFDRDRMAKAEQLLLELTPEETVLAHDLKRVDMKPEQEEFLALKSLAMLEDMRQTFGTESYHLFLKSWIQQRALKKQAFTLDEFLTYARANLVDIYNGKMSPDRLNDWAHGWGMLSVAKPEQAVAMAEAEAEAGTLSSAQRISDFMQTFKELSVTQFPDWPDHWQSREWGWALTYLDGDTSNEHLMAVHDYMVENRSQLSPLLLRDWYLKAISLGFNPVDPYVEQYLTNERSALLLLPLYRAYKETLDDDKMVLELYEKVRDRYHSRIIEQLDDLVGWQQPTEQ